MELSCPVDVEDGGEVLGVAVKEKLWWISRHKLIAELENLRMVTKIDFLFVNLLNSFSSHQLSKS